MADFALWATACETAFWPAGTFTLAYQANRRAAIESVIDTDPVAACMREIMTDLRSWTGSASDLLIACADWAGDDVSRRSAAGPKIPARSLAACVGCRRSCGDWASTLRSVVKATPAAGSSGYVGLSKIPSAPSAASAAMEPRLRRRPPPSVGEFATTVSTRFGRPVPAIGPVLRQAADDADANAAFQGGHHRFRICGRRPRGPGAI